MLKRYFSFALFVTFLFASIPVALADVWVNGYYRSNGTYVNGHYRSDPDGDPYNNWSFPGNTNPYTGVTATGNPSTYLKNYSSWGSSYDYDWGSDYDWWDTDYDYSDLSGSLYDNDYDYNYDWGSDYDYDWLSDYGNDYDYDWGSDYYDYDYDWSW